MMNLESLNRQNLQMTLRFAMASYQWKVTSSIVITVNFGFNCTCRRKEHSLSH